MKSEKRGIAVSDHVYTVEELRSSLDKDMDVFDITHLEEGATLDSEIKKNGVVLYEK